jgi:hypothetical protein
MPYDRPMRTVLATAVLCASCGSNTFGQHIATASQRISALTMAQSKIYGLGDTQVYEIDPSRGSATPLNVLSYSGLVLAAAGNQIYFPTLTNDGSEGVGTYDLTAGVQRTVVPPFSGRVDELLADGTRIYWVSTSPTDFFMSSSIHVTGADGTGEVILDTGAGLFQDDQALYWTGSGGHTIRARKADLSSRISLVSGGGVAAVYAGNIYWSRAVLGQNAANEVLKLPTDGSATTPTIVATVPMVLPQGTRVAAIRFLAGTIYLELVDMEPGDCPGICFFIAHIVEIGPSAPTEIARAEHLTYTPAFDGDDHGVYWALGTDVYRVR